MAFKNSGGAAASAGILNAALRLAGGSGTEVTAADWEGAVQAAGGQTDPNNAARAVLEALAGRTGPAGQKVLMAVDGKGAAASPKKTGGSGISAQRAAFMNADAAPVQPPSGPPAASSPKPATGAGAPAAAGSGIAAQRAAFMNADAAPVQPPSGPPKPSQRTAAAPAPAAKPAPPAGGGGGGGGKWTGPGMFLTYEPAQNGSLFCVYSQAGVGSAIAYAKPGKPIPGFKFNTGGGKTELVRGASDAKQFMRGVAAFVKAAKAHSGSVDINETGGMHAVQVYIHYAAGDKVAKAEPGALTSTDDLDAVVCIPQANADLKGVTQMAKGVFVQRGDSSGGSAS